MAADAAVWCKLQRRTLPSHPRVTSCNTYTTCFMLRLVAVTVTVLHPSWPPIQLNKLTWKHLGPLPTFHCITHSGNTRLRQLDNSHLCLCTAFYNRQDVDTFLLLQNLCWSVFQPHKILLTGPVFRYGVPMFILVVKYNHFSSTFCTKLTTILQQNQVFFNFKKIDLL